MRLSKEYIPIIVICILQIVGLFGFFIDHVKFQSLSPFSLLLSSILVFLMESQKKSSFYFTIILIGFFGFLIEVIGVKTGSIFGIYHYGNSLGYKLFSVPLLIGINWSVLLYATIQFSWFKNPALKASFGAFLMVFLDFFIEQNAPKYDFWYWKDDIIPLQNYVAWFIFSFILNLIFQKNLTKSSNFTAKGFYIVQFLFFFTLYLFS